MSTENGIIWNPVTAASWAATGGGQVTFTTTTAHNVTVGKSFDILGMTPSGYDGTYTAIAGTTGSTLVAAHAGSLSTATGFGNLQTDICGSLGTVGALGGCGTYIVSSMALTAASADFYALNQVPGGAVFLSPAVTTSNCNVGFNIVTASGVFTGTPGATYWFGVSMSTSPAGTFTSSTNAQAVFVTY